MLVPLGPYSVADEKYALGAHWYTGDTTATRTTGMAEVWFLAGIVLAGVGLERGGRGANWSEGGTNLVGGGPFAKAVPCHGGGAFLG